MTFIPTPHGARIVVNWTSFGQDYSYVLHATKTDFSQQDMIDLAAAVDNVHGTTTMATFSNDVTYKNTTVYDVRTSTGQLAVNVDHTGNGTLNNDVVPINCAVCVTVRTAARGRSGRGRVYVTGYDEGVIGDGKWTATATGRALNYVQDLWDAITGAGWTYVIRSVQQDGVKLTIANTRPVIAISVRGLGVASQRRRIDRA